MYACALLSPLSRPSTRGLRRRVARCPQRVLNTAMHFTACKAIISIPTSLTPPSAAGTAESAHLRMESGFLNRDVIDLPLFVRGKCSQTSQANFAALHSQEHRWALGLRGEKNINITMHILTLAHTQWQIHM